jgi:hypothetical protein
MVKKLGQQVVRQLGQLPGEIVEKAAEQTGVAPPKEAVEPTEKDEAKKELAQKAAISKKASLKRAAEIQAEINQLVRARKVAREQAKQAAQLKEQEEVVVKKKVPPAEVKGKRPRGLFIGARRRQEKAQAEKVGRRVSG